VLGDFRILIEDGLRVRKSFQLLSAHGDEPARSEQAVFEGGELLSHTWLQLGRKAGDVLLKINIAPHARYRLDDHDLIATVPLAPWEAALGARVDVPTMEGEVTLTIPAGSQSGQRLRLRGKGLPKRGDKKERGDLYAELRIVVPKTLTEQERALYERLRDESEFRPRP